MKIVHIISYFQPEFGYEEYYHAIAQANLGHEVYVISSKYYHPLLTNKKRKLINSDSLEDNITIIRLKSIEFTYTRQNILLGVKLQINYLQPDLIYLHGTGTLLSYYILSNCKNEKIKYVVDTHEDGTYQKRDGIVNTFKDILITYISNYTISKSHLVLFYSEKIKNRYWEIIKKNSINYTVASIGVSCDRFFFDDERRKEIRKKYNIDKEDFLVVFSGRLVREKKYHNFIECMIRCKIFFKIMFIGKIDNEYCRLLIKIWNKYNLNSKDLIFIDNVNSRLLYRYYSAADLGLWISNSSVGILEAYACKLPAIINREALFYYPAINEDLIVDLNDYQSALNIIQILAQDNVLLKSYKEKSVEIAKKYDYKLIAANVIRKI